MHIKKGDNVKVIAGNDKGKTGSVVRAFPKLNKVIVAGINLKKKHQRTRKEGKKGEIINIEMPLHASNVVKTK
jgi:large subunit ribosomal protein L24